MLILHQKGQYVSNKMSRAPERFFNRVSSYFINKHWTKLERLARDKHSSLLRTFVNYDRKLFYNIEPRLIYDGLKVKPGQSLSDLYRGFEKYSISSCSITMQLPLQSFIILVSARLFL